MNIAIEKVRAIWTETESVLVVRIYLRLTTVHLGHSSMGHAMDTLTSALITIWLSLLLWLTNMIAVSINILNIYRHILLRLLHRLWLIIFKVDILVL